MGNKLTGRRLVPVLFVLAIAGSLTAYWWSRPSGSGATPVAKTTQGGHLVATVRSEPRSFNHLVARDRVSNLISLFLHEKLVRTNISTQQVEPALAESWTSSNDGRVWTLKLRKGVLFSDGTPFTSDDVLFSLQAVYDPKTASPLGGSLSVGDKPLEATAPDPETVVLTYPAPFGPGVRLLNNLPILPKHKLGAALQNGTLRDAWGLTVSPGDIVGLGPFVLKEYRPGERLAFGPNPHYWRQENGHKLPRLDMLTLLVVPDQNAELLNLESGETDIITDDVRPEDLASVKRAVEQGRMQVFDVGVSLDANFLWFNLKPGAVASGKTWIQKGELRKAISLAVDRRAFADTVYLGAAVPIAGPVTPGNHDWFDPSLTAPSQDLARARQLLAAAGLTDKNGDGQLEAPDGSPARFALLTQKGQTLRERGAAFIQQDLAKLGLQVDVVTLEVPALIERLTGGDYEAAYFGVQASDTDPATNLDYWLSTGAFHLWNPAQPKPATPWEARIDELMHKQVASTDRTERQRLFNEVQKIFFDELPAIYFVAPRVVLATSGRVTGVQAGLLQPYILSDAATLGVK